MRKSRTEESQDTQQGHPEEADDTLEMPPGFDLGTGEGEAENLEDLEEGPQEEGEESEEPEQEVLRPEEIRALREELATKDALLGRMGQELGTLRQQTEQAATQFGMPGMAGGPSGQQAADPMALYRHNLKAATDRFVQYGDVDAFVDSMAGLNMGLAAALGRHFEARLTDYHAQTKAEVDFFAKHSDLVEGTPRSIFEGEFAKLRLAEPRAPATELRQRAAKATRDQLREWGWRMEEETRTARREGGKLRGPAPRQSRTGSASNDAGAAIGQSRTEYLRSLREHQRSRGA